MFSRIDREHNVRHVPKKASTVISTGDVMVADGSGAFEPAGAASTNIKYLALKEVLSSDADYADNSDLMVDEIGPEDVVEADVTTGTLTTAMIGERYDLNSTGDGIDVTSQSTNQVEIYAFISASKALVKFVG